MAKKKTTVVFPPHLRPEGYPWITPKTDEGSREDSEWLKLEMSVSSSASVEDVEAFLHGLLASRIGSELASDFLNAFPKRTKLALLNRVQVFLESEH